ncbi:MAG: type IV pilus twitching motility protein PilT [Deltaproteobacteria bacterium]|nr:type IV pilus twitching motility protein PilT [Deltaproteobacteria bacterium]
MVSRRSSDLHLTCGHLIAFRVDGDIVREEKGPPLSPAMLEHLLLPIIPDFKRAQFAKFWDVDFAYALAGVGRFRVNLFRDNHGVGAVFRYIPDKVLTLEELGAPDALFNFCKMAKGLVLVTGPTGSGKSTTQAAMIDFINEARHEHIITIEDPIEFVHPQKKCLINQREVGKHTESFSQALRAALREDPDVVLVGELRDLETTSIALETAETGHLVFGTLHTNTAVSTIDRVIDQYPTEQQRIIRNTLAASLRGVVTQVLCRKKEGGRCAAYEILVTDDAVAAMIREGKNHMIPSHMQTQKAAGNRLLNESLLKLVMEGLVDYEEAWKKSINRKEFEETLKKKGGSRAA